MSERPETEILRQLFRCASSTAVCTPALSLIYSPAEGLRIVDLRTGRVYEVVVYPLEGPDADKIAAALRTAGW